MSMMERSLVQNEMHGTPDYRVYLPWKSRQ